MKTRYMFLLAFISCSSIAQEIDRGHLSFTMPGMSIQVPIDRISFNNDDEITIRAYGRITEPSYTMIILSIVFHKLSTDPQDLNIEKCWLSLDHKNNFTDDFYLSFGFQDFFAFYSSQTEQRGDVKKIQATTSRLCISKIENMNNRLLVTGYFACSFINIHSGKIEHIKIQDGTFTLVAEQNKTIATAKEEEVPPSPVDPSIAPSYYFIILPQMQSTPLDKETYSDSSVPFTDQDQSSPTPPPPSPPCSNDHRLTHTGRGPLVSNPAPARNDENNKGTRDPGLQRGRR